MEFKHIRIVNPYQIGAIKRAIKNHITKFDDKITPINWYCGITNKEDIS